MSSNWRYLENKRLPAAAYWNGIYWKNDEIVYPAGASEADTEGVSCLAEETCFAVGSATAGTSGSRTLIERSANPEKGEWAIQESPNQKEATENNLTSVSCTSIDSCTAVGRYTNGSHEYQALAEHWNGATWTVQETPISQEASLASVSCASSESCMAVGDYVTYPYERHMFTERWNGEAWSIVEPSIPVEAAESELQSVACTSPDSCVAVGGIDGLATSAPVAEYWDGKSWTFHELPGGAEGIGVAGVSCPSKESCTAVGERYSDHPRAVAEHWNGTTWTIQETPSPSVAEASVLYSVSCLSGESCIATGQAAILPTNEKASLLAERMW